MATDSASGETRRDFLQIVGWSGFGLGVAAAVWPFVHQMNPSADVLALASTDVDLSTVEEGMAITVQWRGKPVFIRYRTSAEIEEAQNVDLAELRDPATDEERTMSALGVSRPQWLVQIGICTHLGCVPLGNRVGEPKGDYNGWFCPCHGSHYDTAGRIRKGPAPRNLDLPPYAFTSDTEITIG
jgi:ubiquinol-cytochrome c reductase iron-sulfur subunit